jgi:hypothetical protein
MAPVSLAHLLILVDVVARIRIIDHAEPDFDMLANLELVECKRLVFIPGLGLAIVSSLVGVRCAGVVASLRDLCAG